MLLTRAELGDIGVTRGAIAGPTFQRIVHGVHAPAAAENDLVLTCRALQLVVPHGVFSHRTAAQLLGLPVWRAPKMVEMTVAPPKNPPRHRGVKGYECALSPTEIAQVNDLRVTSAPRTFVDLAAVAARSDVVTVGDAMLRRGIVNAAELEATLIQRAGRRGVAAARWALARLDASAGSPIESLIRLRFEDEGLPRPECNVNLYDALGGFIACVDLLVRSARIVVEVEGAHHLERHQFRRDTVRDRLLIANGYFVLRATARDIEAGKTDLFDTIAQLLRRTTPA